MDMHTPFSKIYKLFLSKITEDMYMELTPEDTYKLLHELLLSSIAKFEFPRQNLDYEYEIVTTQQGDQVTVWYFYNLLTDEQQNILATYMIVEWIGQQLASVENTRMKYSGADFKFTSQANHMQKLLQLKKDYEREGFHLQRLYKRRIRGCDGIYHSTFGQIMQAPQKEPYRHHYHMPDENWDPQHKWFFVGCQPYLCPYQNSQTQENSDSQEEQNIYSIK